MAVYNLSGLFVSYGAGRVLQVLIDSFEEAKSLAIYGKSNGFLKILKWCGSYWQPHKKLYFSLSLYKSLLDEVGSDPSQFTFSLL